MEIVPSAIGGSDEKKSSSDSGSSYDVESLGSFTDLRINKKTGKFSLDLMKGFLTDDDDPSSGSNSSSSGSSINSGRRRPAKRLRKEVQRRSLLGPKSDDVEFGHRDNVPTDGRHIESQVDEVYCVSGLFGLDGHSVPVSDNVELEQVVFIGNMFGPGDDVPYDGGHIESKPDEYSVPLILKEVQRRSLLGPKSDDVEFGHRDNVPTDGRHIESQVDEVYCVSGLFGLDGHSVPASDNVELEQVVFIGNMFRPGDDVPYDGGHIESKQDEYSVPPFNEDSVDGDVPVDVDVGSVSINELLKDFF